MRPAIHFLLTVILAKNSIQLFVYILLYIRSIHILPNLRPVSNDKRRGLTDPILLDKLGILLSIDNLQLFAFQHFLCHTAVRTSASRKKIFMRFHRLDLHLVTLHGHHTGMDLFQMGMGNIIEGTVLVLLGLTIVPVLYRTVISCDTAVNLSLLSTFRAGEMLAADVAMLLTYGIGR